jgi:hypothetical protein
MARFHGVVGYGVPSQFVAGVWSDTITERAYYGRVLNETQAHEFADKVNDDLRLQSRISIVADAYAFGNYAYIKYVKDEETGIYWAVTSIQLSRPRLILSTGGVYNGPKPNGT